MQINGPRKLVKRAVHAACLFNLYDFTLVVDWGNNGETFLYRNEAGLFEMTIDRNTPKPLLAEVVGHEMVHLRQYLRGDLEDTEKGTFWKGEFYSEPDLGSDDYYFAPWEMEARAYQEWIAVKWETRQRELH